MSRYLKTASAAIYTRKKSYLVPGNYSFNIPVTSNEVKVMVFGGGGNACFAQVTTCGATGNCGFAMGGASGPEGDLQKKFTPVLVAKWGVFVLDLHNPTLTFVCVD